MFKLLKYLIFLTVIVCGYYYFTTDRGLPFSVPELPRKILKSISAPPLEKLQRNSTNDIVKRLQSKDLSGLKSIWNQLGIKSRLFKRGSPFLAESSNLASDLNNNTLLVFKITDREDQDWQLLLFDIKNRNWHFYGHIDLASQSQSEPMARTVMIEDRIWLVVTSLAQPNLSGIFQEVWYDLDASQLNEVLRYNVYQDSSEAEFIKRYSATVVKTGKVAGVYFIDLRYKIAYLNDFITRSGLETTFSIARTVRYHWDQSARQFKSQQPTSNQSNFANYGADEILKENYLQFKDLARQGNYSERNLVKRFLNQCGNISEKKMLLSSFK